MDAFALNKTLVRLQVKETVLILTASVILPFLVHLIPAVAGIPVGAILLPMFYAPFIAVILFRPHVAIITGLLAPTLNSLLTGHPTPEKIALLSLELVVFSVIAYSIHRKLKNFWATAALAYLVTVLSVTCVLVILPNFLPQLAPMDFFLNAILNSLPGLVMLLLINIVLLRSQPKYKK